MASENKNLNFIEEIITADIESGRVKEVITRFPPEPNGYLHIGHAKSICLNFGTAKEFGGRCNLRFDDTNPAKEETEYVESIMEDVKWLGFEWANLCYASDYFEQFHKWAIDLIKAGKAYVDDQSAEEIRTNRGTLTKPGVDSPYRNRSVEENLDLFARMTAQARASPHRSEMVRLPDVRLRARLRGRHRGRHALDMHARVPGPQAALRLVHRQRRRAARAASVRVRAPQPHIHRHEQAQAARARDARHSQRLGRPAHAHHLRLPPPRLHGLLLPRGRRCEGRQPRRDRAAPALSARGAQQDGAARHGCARPGQARHRELARGLCRRARRGEQPRGRLRGQPQGQDRPRNIHRARRLPRASSASRRARRCASSTPTS